MLSYPEFEARLWAATERHHLPIAGSVELTYRCNFRCVHCYQQDVREQAELDLDAWTKILDQLAEAGCLWLTLTGGEPTEHASFAAIYERAIRRGFLVTVFSNGSTLTDEVVGLFRRLPPRTLEVTLYGASPATYQRVTGSVEHYAAAMAGVRRAIDVGLDVRLKSMAFADTVADLVTVQTLAQELGRPFRFDTLVHATLGGSHGPTAGRLAPAVVLEVETQAQRRAAATKAVDSAPRPADADRVYRCGAGTFGFTIAPDGHAQMCSLVRNPRYDLATISFAEAWAALGQESQRRYAQADSRCGGCAIRHLCSTCPGIAQLELADPEGAVDDVCHTAHLRAAAQPGRFHEPAPHGSPQGGAAPGELP